MSWCGDKLGLFGHRLLLLFMSIYAALGVYLFENVKYGKGVSNHANFETWQRAVRAVRLIDLIRLPIPRTAHWQPPSVCQIITLLRTSTGEAWNLILQDCMRGECADPTVQAGCGAPQHRLPQI